jgi:hypothetical protein
MGMGMSSARRGNENDRYRMVAEHENGLCAGRREPERQNREWWQNTEWAEQGMTDYYWADGSVYAAW